MSLGEDGNDLFHWLLDKAAEWAWQAVFATLLGGSWSLGVILGGFDKGKIPWGVAASFLVAGIALVVVRRVRSREVLEIYSDTEEERGYHRIRVKSHTAKTMQLGAKLIDCVPIPYQTLPMALQFTHDAENGTGREIVPLDGNGTVPVDVFHDPGQGQPVSLRGRVHKPNITRQKYTVTIKVYTENAQAEKKFEFNPLGHRTSFRAKT